MASHVLRFPSNSAEARRSRLRPAPFVLAGSGADTAEAIATHGLQLVHSRPRSEDSAVRRTMTQAQLIAAQVERELAGRVQREAATRRHGNKTDGPLPSTSPDLTSLAAAPAQATEVGLRHRLLDALLFFGRPA